MKINDVTIDEHNNITGADIHITENEQTFLIAFALNILYHNNKLYQVDAGPHVGMVWQLAPEIGLQ